MSQDGFDFEDSEKFDTELDEQLAGVEVAAKLFLSAMRTLNAPTPTDAGISGVLDFFAPWGAAKACFYAVCLLDRGRLSINDDEDYDIVAARVRRQCSDMLASGRVKEAGQRRESKPKPAPEWQGDLFEGAER